MKKNNIIKFSDLSKPLKASIVFLWAYITYIAVILLTAFFLGVADGIKGGIS